MSRSAKFGRYLNVFAWCLVATGFSGFLGSWLIAAIGMLLHLALDKLRR